jgi:hypothetical protein
MNTPTFKGPVIWIMLLLWIGILGQSCNKTEYVYGIEDQLIKPINSEKNKPKTSMQYISILYTNLFRKPMSPNELLDAQRAIESIGDKQIAYDILVSKMIRNPEVLIPSDEEMRENPEKFIRNLYTRFLIRQPTEAELNWMRNYLFKNPKVTAEQFYFAFATSNEHFHY